MKMLLSCAAATVAVGALFAGAAPARAQYVQTMKLVEVNMDPQFTYGDGWSKTDAGLMVKADSYKSGDDDEIGNDADRVCGNAFVQWEWRGERNPPLYTSHSGSSYVVGSVLAFLNGAYGIASSSAGTSSGSCDTVTANYTDSYSGSKTKNTGRALIIDTTIPEEAYSRASYNGRGGPSAFVHSSAEGRLDVSAPEPAPTPPDFI